MAQNNFTGGVNTAIDDAGNWSISLPTIGDPGFISNGSTGLTFTDNNFFTSTGRVVTIDDQSDVTYTGTARQITGRRNSEITINHPDAELNFTFANATSTGRISWGNTNNETATINLIEGTLNWGQAGSNRNWLGNQGTGIINQSGGTFTVRGANLDIQVSNAGGADEASTLAVSGGTFNVPEAGDDVLIGYTGRFEISGDADVNITDDISLGTRNFGGGTLTIADTATVSFDDLNIGNDNDHPGTDLSSPDESLSFVDISGGTVVIGDTTGDGNQNTDGVITIGRGTSLNVLRAGNGRLTIRGTADVTARSLVMENSTTASEFNLQGGTLLLNGNDNPNDGDFIVQGEIGGVVAPTYVDHRINIRGGELTLTDDIVMDTGTYTQTDGTVSMQTFDANGQTQNITQDIAVNISGGVLTTSTGNIQIGNDSNATMTVSGTAQVTVGLNGTGAQDLQVNDKGTFTIDGGTVHVVDDFVSSPDFSNDGQNQVNINGGTIRVGATTAADGTTNIGTASTSGEFTLNNGTDFNMTGGNLRTGDPGNPVLDQSNRDFNVNGADTTFDMSGGTIYTETDFDFNDGVGNITGGEIIADDQFTLDGGTLTISSATITANRNITGGNDDGVIIDGGDLVIGNGGRVISDKERSSGIADNNGNVRIEDGSTVTINSGGVLQAEQDVFVGIRNSTPSYEAGTLVLNGGIVRVNSANITSGSSEESRELQIREMGTLTGTGFVENGQIELDDGHFDAGLAGSTLFLANDDVFDTITVRNRTDAGAPPSGPIADTNESIRIEGAGQEVVGSKGATVNIDLGSLGNNDKVVLGDGRAEWLANTTLNLNNVGNALEGGSYTIIDDTNEGSGNAILNFENTGLEGATGGDGATDFGTVPDGFAFRLHADDTQNVVLDVREIANASFSDSSDQNTLNIDFGTIVTDGSGNIIGTNGGNGTNQMEFSLHNLNNAGLFSYDFDFVSWTDLTGAGAGAYSTSFSDTSFTSVIGGGTTGPYSITLDTNTFGNFFATATINLAATQNISGGLDPQAGNYFSNLSSPITGPQVLTLNISGTIAPVPEPTTVFPIIGLMSVLAARRKRRKLADRQ